MSKHWSSRVFDGARTAPVGRPVSYGRKRPRLRWKVRGQNVRLALLLGLLFGALYVAAIGTGWRLEEAPAKVDFDTRPAPDPYAESRRSRDILREQEGPPVPRMGANEPAWATRRVGRGDVVDVIDGDTFLYGGEKIRIADIDTPEVQGRCAEESALAARATDRLAVLLAQGPFTLESIERDEDRYGRKLRIVTRGGRSIGDQLVEEGLARTWEGRRRPWCA